MSKYKLIYPPVRTCQSETEICNLFERHVTSLLHEKQRMINEIIEWEKNLIRQIQVNVNEQKDRLERDCKDRLEYLQIKRQEFLDTALIYEERRDREEVRQLLEQCHGLKVQLATLEYPEQSIPFIQVQRENQQSSNKRNLQTKSMIETEKYPSNATSTSVNANQTNQQLGKTTSFTTDDRYANSNSSLNFNAIDDSDIVEKCPACFVIFSSTMGPDERSRHVNQHFGDY